MGRLSERLVVARRALATLVELPLDGVPTKVERDAAIQRFEYTFEAVWKAAQLFLREIEGLEIGSPKGAVRASLQVGLLNEGEARTALDRDPKARLVRDAERALPSPRWSSMRSTSLAASITI